GNNSLTLIRTSPVLSPFNLNSLLVGPSTAAPNPNVNVTISGTQVGGGTLSTTYTGLTTATVEVLNWSDLTSIGIVSSTDAGLDNIDVTPVPEPSTLTLLALGGIGLAVVRRRLSWRVNDRPNFHPTAKQD